MRRNDNNGTKYTGCSLIRKIVLGDDYATQIEHFDTDNESLLVYTTAKGKISALDIRSMKTAWEFQAPANHGQLTSLLLDGKHSWAMTGSHRGVLSVWDIRFQLCANIWRHPSMSRINQLEIYPFLPRGFSSNPAKLVAMSVENQTSELSVWDIETASCYKVWGSIYESLPGRSSDIDIEVNRIYGDGMKVSPSNNCSRPILQFWGATINPLVCHFTMFPKI